MLDHRKLTVVGHNHVNWIHTLRKVLRKDKEEYILDAPLPYTPKAYTVGEHVVEAEVKDSDARIHAMICSIAEESPINVLVTKRVG